MSSNLRVNNIFPSVGTNVAIGTAGGSITLTGGVTGSSIINTGVTTVAAGSTSAPSISPSGDSNTGIFFPSDDTIAFAEGGAEALRVNSSGNLGIGTNNPTTKLDVFVNGGEGLPANVTGERMRIIANDVVGRSGFLSIIAGSSAYSGVFFGDKDAADVGKIRYYHADNSLQFLVNGTTEAFRATSSGNLAFPSGQGIDFSATANSSGTMTSELLNDYEEGSFTPSFTNGGTCTYTVQIGRYTKIGNLVTVHVHLDIGTQGSASGNLAVQGLPFSVQNISSFYGSTSSIHAGGWSVSRSSLNGLAPGNTSYVDIYYNSGSTTISLVQHSDYGTGNLLFTLSYQTA